MTKLHISEGTIHKVPSNIQKILLSQPKIHTIWEDITPLARNEWLCWIESAKKQETSERRLRIMQENLLTGKRRPCCWAGCIHRK